MTPFADSQVQEVYNSNPEAQKSAMLELRELVFQTAKETAQSGALSESLKWGQPSISTPTGSPIRIDKVKDKEEVAMYFICTTKLIDQFKERYPDTFKFQGNRSIHFPAGTTVPKEELAHCIAMALTYKVNK